MKILITGAAGFIGFHAVKHFAENGDRVVGIDNINNYYNVDLKYDRLKETGICKALIKDHKAVQSVNYPNYRFFKADLLDKAFIDELFEREHFDVVCNLAAQAGGTIFNRKSVCLHRYQYCWIPEYSGSLPVSSGTAPGLCQFEQRLRPE